MPIRLFSRPRLIAALVSMAWLACSPLARAEALRVWVSGGMAPAYKVLGPQFEKRTGQKIETVYAVSLGTSPGAMPVRLDRGEPVDVLIMVKDGIAPLVAKGQVDARSVVDLADSKIAAAVREGAPVPDMGTVEAFRAALLNARSIAYSDSASGIYLSGELFKRLGVADQIADRMHQIPATPVGEAIARGEYELGFQQYSELLPVKGIHIIGLIPDAVQKVTVYAAAMSSHPRSPAAARKLLRFLRSHDADRALLDSGLQPASQRH